MQKEINFIINTSEITAGTRGASLGPLAIITAARKIGSSIFGDNKVTFLEDKNHLLDHPTNYRFAKRIDGLLDVYNNVSNAVFDSVNSNEFPFVLAADHGSAGGTIAGIRKSFPDKKLGVIWIDAHGDLHSPYTTPSGNIHGMPLSTALNEDNIPCKSNDVDAETISMWNQLKELHGIAPKITPENLVFIAVRDTEHQEDALMERLNIKNFKVEEVNDLGAKKVAVKTLEKLNDCDIIYISFDVDSMDPDITSYGTGTPVKNGLLPSQVAEIFNELIESQKVVCIEFVEVNPCLDEKINTMAETAFELLQPIVKQIKS
jgi:arginase